MACGALGGGAGGSRVLLLVDGTERDRLMRAEVLRELGRFEEAEEVLAGVTARELEWTVSQIRSMCRARDVQVRELQRGL